LTPGRAQRSLSLIQDLEIPTIPSFDLVPQTLSMAIKDDRTVYDSVYVALALQTKASLITADERLANALAAHLPVKWLGAL
jgi:predicted nucleic acid-binding protein